MTLFLLSILIFSSLLYFRKPQHNRDWRPEQSILPQVYFSGNKVFIKNIRNCSYRSVDDFMLNYYDKEFDLKKIKSMDLVIQPFKKMSLAAHIFLSFGFEGGSYLSVSVEARRRRNKEFSVFWGLFRRFELIYILADEGDIMRLRPLHMKEKVHIYPLKIKKNKIRKIFIDILERVNKIEQKSEFYNSLTNSCISNVFLHMKKGGDLEFPRTWKLLFPSTLDKLFYDVKLIKTNLSFDKLKEKTLINMRAAEHEKEEDYSKRIRRGI